MMMKRKLNKTSKSLKKAQADNSVEKRNSMGSDDAAGKRRYNKLDKKGSDILAKRHRISNAQDRLNKKPVKDVKFDFNNREAVAETFDETLEEGPFKGIGKILMKRKLNKTSKSLAKQKKDIERKDMVGFRRPYEPNARLNDVKSKTKRIQKATDRLNRKPNDDKFDFNNR